MFDVRIKENNTLHLKWTRYTNTTESVVEHVQKFDDHESLKAYVFGSTVCLVDNHFQAFFNLLTHNRDYIYSRCKNRVKISLEDYDYTLQFGKVILLKNEMYDPSSSIYRCSKLIELNIDFLYSIPQRMKIKGFEATNILNDLNKESKLILRNIKL